MKILSNCSWVTIIAVMVCFCLAQQVRAGCCNDYVVGNPCGCDSVCGPIGSAAEALLAIPSSVIGALTGRGNNNCCNTNDCCGYVRYSRGCALSHCPGQVADVAPRRTEIYYTERAVPVPAYITYGIVDQAQTASRPIPPVISFNGPLAFEQR